jgi:hypothetical protein
LGDFLGLEPDYALHILRFGGLKQR